MSLDPFSNIHIVSEQALERMFAAAEKTRARIGRCIQSLESESIPYTIASEHAVAAP